MRDATPATIAGFRRYRVASVMCGRALMSASQVRAARVGVLAVVVIVVVVWSTLRGAPHTLPGAALGWAPLFYVERDH
jgi:hypothetical protein